VKTLIVASLVVGLALTAGASALASEDGQSPAANPTARRACFFSHQINGWREGNSSRDNVVYLDVRARDVYRLDMFGPCNGLNEAISIGVETRGGGTAICDGLDVTLITRSAVGPYRCPVSKITRLTPEEVKALAASKRR
jgi:hypothetical protein